MNRLQTDSQTLNMCIDGLLSNFPCKSYICSHPLLERVTSNWKVMLMDCSTIIAIASFALALFMGSPFVCAAFFITAVASGVGAFYMRQFSALADLEDTAKELKETKEKIEIIAKDLQTENNRLSESNRELQRNNAIFRESNQNLIQTNTRLNQQVTQLTLQVTQLSLQVTQLRESAERIRSEVIRFQHENSHLHASARGFEESLRVLDQQILGSRSLCEQIAGHLASHERGLGVQLEQLGRYLTELRAENRVHEKIQELGTLQREITQSAAQLHTIQLQYAEERAKFQTIHDALVLLREQFDLAIRDAVNNLRVNNQHFSANVSALAAERQRIHDLIHRHFSTPPPPAHS